MAYMSQTKKAELAPKIKEVLKKHGLKGSISVNNHSTLVVTIKSGKIDFKNKYSSVNHYWIQDHYQGKAKEALLELKDAMMVGHYDHSNSQIDYFNVSWYIDIRIGNWNKPYVLGGNE